MLACPCRGFWHARVEGSGMPGPWKPRYMCHVVPTRGLIYGIHCPCLGHHARAPCLCTAPCPAERRVRAVKVSTRLDCLLWQNSLVHLPRGSRIPRFSDIFTLFRSQKNQAWGAQIPHFGVFCLKIGYFGHFERFGPMFGSLGLKMSKNHQK